MPSSTGATSFAETTAGVTPRLQIEALLMTPPVVKFHDVVAIVLPAASFTPLSVAVYVAEPARLVVGSSVTVLVAPSYVTDEAIVLLAWSLSTNEMEA